MGLILDITRALLPLLIVGVIVVFVIKRLEHKQKAGKLWKKDSIREQNLLTSLIPLGMFFGIVAGIMISIYFSFSLLSALTIGAAIGYLIGYIAYEIYGRYGESYS